jgi:predicted  nucleic acid-binding Zn-ribbon protein
MLADNLTADTEGADIPFSGDDFKEMSNLYRRKFGRITLDLENLMEKDEIVIAGESDGSQED